VRIILHHAAKDIRANRWLLSAWLAALVANVAVYSIHSLLLLQISDSAFASSVSASAWQLAGALQSVAGWLIAIRMVLADPLDDTSAFWLTRPISARQLLLAKFGTISTIFLVLPACCRVAVAVANGTDWALAARVAVEWTALDAVLLWPLVLVASMTRDRARLVILGVFATFAFFILRLSVGHPTTIGAVAAWAFGLLALIGLIAHQYLTRRRLRTLLLTLATVLVASGLYALGQSALLPGFAVGPGDPSAIGLDRLVGTLNPPAMAQIEGTSDPYKQVAKVRADFRVGGLPATWFVRPLTGKGTLTVDGEPPVMATWKTDVWRNEFQWVEPDASFTAPEAVGRAIGARMLPRLFPYRRTNDVVFTLPSEVFRRVAGRRSHYKAEFDVVAFEILKVGTIPLRPGASIVVGSRMFTFEEFEPLAGLFHISVSAAGPRLILPWRATDVEFLAHNPAQNEAAPFFGWTPNIPGLGLATSGLNVGTIRFSLPPLVGDATKQPRRGLSDVRRAWLESSELAVVRIIDRGRFTIRVTDDEFVIPEWPTR
jgi:hypothetical protein